MSYSLKLLTVNISLILIVIGLLTMNFSWGHKIDQEMSEEGKMMYGFVGKTGKDLGLKYGMNPDGIGGGATKEGIWLMCLSFEKRGDSLTEQQARKLITSNANDFLELINNDERLKPFLKEYPFTIKNIKLSIHSSDHNGNSYADPFIATVNISRGEIGYFTFEIADRFPYKTEKYELFEESIAILKEEKKAE